jgi:uncharacterized protein (DUF2249 family)
MTRATATSLDLRVLPPKERHEKFFQLFDSLPEGDSLVLINDHDPRPLYYELKSVRPDTFGWHTVSAGPLDWRVEIRRLKPKESEESIQAYFERDHEEIDVLLTFLRRDLAEADRHRERPSSAWARLFDDFNQRLERHIRWEEEILFPAVEQKSPALAFGPGRVMRMEHVEIRRLKGLAGDRLRENKTDAPSLQKAAQELDQMVAVLVGHNQKEEAVYYPMSDQMFSRSEAAELLKRVRSLAP